MDYSRCDCSVLYHKHCQLETIITLTDVIKMFVSIDCNILFGVVSIAVIVLVFL